MPVLLNFMFKIHFTSAARPAPHSFPFTGGLSYAKSRLYRQLLKACFFSSVGCCFLVVSFRPVTDCKPDAVAPSGALVSVCASTCAESSVVKGQPAAYGLLFLGCSSEITCLAPALRSLLSEQDLIIGSCFSA